jgi:hypothetical protein
MTSELRRLSDLDPTDVMKGKQIRGSNVGVTLASSFHPQMWSVRVSRYMCPMDCFQDDVRLRQVIRRAFTVWPDRHGANASSLRIMLKTFSNCAAVSNFRPTVARAVIQAFTAPDDLIVDFAAGYGGRLVGCLSLPRHYLGIEPCGLQVRGLKQCIQTVGKLKCVPGTGEIQKGCAEDILPQLPSRSARLVFSSPPYFDWEKYSDHNTQSFVRYRSYSQWLAKFLHPVVEQSHRILSKGGHLAVNMPNGGSRIPLLHDLTRAATSAGFTLESVYRLRLSKVAFLHPRGRRVKWEAIAILKK